MEHSDALRKGPVLEPEAAELGTPHFRGSISEGQARSRAQGEQLHQDSSLRLLPGSLTWSSGEAELASEALYQAAT